MKPGENIDIQDVSLGLLAEGIAVKVSLGGYSMLPVLKAGDTATVVKTGREELHKGDIVLFRDSKKVIAHRIIRIINTNSDYTYITKGDSLKKADKPVQYQDILGKIIAFEHKGKENDLLSPRWIKRNKFMAGYSSWFRPFYYLHSVIRRIKAM